jgi:hypothetical protein
MASVRRAALGRGGIRRRLIGEPTLRAILLIYHPDALERPQIEN